MSPPRSPSTVQQRMTRESIYKWELLNENSQGYYRACAYAAIRALDQFSVERVAAYAETECRARAADAAERTGNNGKQQF